MTNLIYKVTAFSDDINGGNPAGVVLNADSFTESKMLRIAQEVGFSETAFVMNSDLADYRVRFFTPVDEVDLCGHATVAAFNLLRDIGIITTGEYTQETKAGILKLQIFDTYIYMAQNVPMYYDVIDKDEIDGCFESQLSDYISDMPIQIVSTGLKDIMLPVKDLETLFALKPNLNLINDISRKYDVVGIHAFCLETLHNGEAHVRNFAPRYGISEESATGTSNGALSCYLMKYLKHRFNGKFVIEQGYSMKRPSKIITELRCNSDEIIEVHVGGSAVLI
jgi:phenazine biosynthesis protein PhzF family